jgi:endonuclease YncB( thermonuclease family)
MAKIISFIGVLFLITACSQAEQNSGYRLQYVQDGDSAVLCCDEGKKFTVRLLDIDAPEKHQPYAEESRAKLKKLLINKELTLLGVKRDRYGRRLVMIEVNGENINDTMVRSGAAWVWRFSKSKKLRALQRQAKEQNLGLWALPEAQRQDPWHWRQTHSRK